MLRKGCLIVLIVLVVLAAVAFLAYRNGVHSKLVLWVIKATWERTEDLEARVEADTDIMGFRVSGAGRLRFKKPDLYDLDFNTVRIIAGRDALWVIVPAFKTGVRITADDMTPTEILADLVADWGPGDPARWVEEATSEPPEVTLYAPTVIDGERCWILEWPSRTGERIGGRLYVSQRSRAPIRFDQMDSANRIIRTYKISQFKRNIGLTEADFDYQPMSGFSTLDYHYDPDKPLGIEGLLMGGGPEPDELRPKIRRKAKDRLPADAARWLRRKGL